MVITLSVFLRSYKAKMFFVFLNRKILFFWFWFCFVLFFPVIIWILNNKYLKSFMSVRKKYPTNFIIGQLSDGISSLPGYVFKRKCDFRLSGLPFRLFFIIKLFSSFIYYFCYSCYFCFYPFRHLLLLYY